MESTEDEVDRALQLLASHDQLPPEEEWLGCSEDDLFTVRAEQFGHLPIAYRRFLKRVGRMPAETRLFLGSDVFWPYPQESRRWADALLAEHQLDALPPYGVPILMHQATSSSGLLVSRRIPRCGGTRREPRPSQRSPSQASPIGLCSSAPNGEG